MTNHMITEKEVQSAITMFWMGSLIVIGVNQDAKQDTWIPILFAFIMFLPMIWLYIRLTQLYPRMNLFEILFQIFGKVFGRIFSLIYILFAIHLGSMVLQIFAKYIHILNMPETPEIVIVSLISFVCIYCARSGPEGIGRISKFTWPILTASIVITCIIAMKDMNLNYLKPVMNTDFKVLLIGGYSMCALPLGESFLCFSLFSSLSPKVKPQKIFMKPLIYTTLLVLLVNLRNILILGIPSAIMFFFPSYQAVSVVSLGEFFTRFEVLIGMNVVLAGAIKICICLYTSSLGLVKVLNITDQKSLVVPCCLLMITLSGMIVSFTGEDSDWIRVYPIYTIPVEIILPIITLIGAEIQTKLKSGGSSKSKSPKGENEPIS